MECLCLFKAKSKKTRKFLIAFVSLGALTFSSVAVYLVSYTDLNLVAIPVGACVASLVLVLTVIAKRFEAVRGCELSCLISKLLMAAGVGVKKKPTHVERIYLYVVYPVFVLINPIGNLFRLYLGTSDEDKHTADNRTDDLVMALLVASVVAYFLSYAHQWWLASSYVWLVLNISFHKLKEIADIARPSPMGDVASRRRTVILSFLNIVQLLFAYAFLYRYFGVTEKEAFLDGLFYAFKVFTTQGLDEAMIILCVWQKILLISQFSVLLIVLIVFVGNMFGIQEEREE